MTLNRLLIGMLILTVFTGCGGGGNGAGSSGGGGVPATPRTLVAVAVTPANPQIALGTVQQFSAIGSYSDNTTQDLTTVATWTSSNSSVALITPGGGRATATATGTTTITAASGGVSGTTTLTVTAATLVSVSVLPANPTAAPGTNLQFSASGTYSDNSTQDLTRGVTWSSSDTTVATISNVAASSGIATPVAAGTTTITATVSLAPAGAGTVSGSSILTVSGGGNPVNVLPITVNGALCSGGGNYLNKPCVSVTVCSPGTSTCQVINDLLLDTGSFGLRIFAQALNVTLLPVGTGSGSLAECVQFADGSSLWGPVRTANVIMGNEPAVQVPIQVVDASFGTRSSGCLSSEASPASAAFNGILGVGLFPQDCGALCTASVNNNIYFACNGSVCSGTTVPLTSQVHNPVALLPRDNNGVLVKLPNVPLGGAASVTGTLVLGIGTQSNNTPSAVTAYPANGAGDFTTIFNGITLNNSFIDSGSNALFFNAPPSLLPSCPSPNNAFYCPAATTLLSATNRGAVGSPSGTVFFQIGNLNTLLGSGNMVFSNIGGGGFGGFDWGMPFFYGRNVYIGIQGTSSVLGSGPYWAY